MPFTLNENQLRILSDNTVIDAVAKHILASDNHVAERFRGATGITRTSKPNQREVQRAIAISYNLIH